MAEISFSELAKMIGAGKPEVVERGEVYIVIVPRGCRAELYGEGGKEQIPHIIAIRGEKADILIVDRDVVEGKALYMYVGGRVTAWRFVKGKAKIFLRGRTRC